MGRLRLAFLGSPQVEHDGRALAFSTRKTLALLIYLATEGGLHTREAITALFWPDSDARRGRAAMRRTLSYLRETLGGTEHLVVEGADLGFDFTADFDLDLHSLRAAWELARPLPQPAAGGDRRRLLAEFQNAVGLYRGDFLAGFSLVDAPDFDDWASVQRELWHRRLDLVLDRLAQLQAEGGQTESALETAARWVAHHPLNEAAHRRLMQLHFSAGDRTAALAAYAACRAILARELNARPAPETEALAEQIRAKAPPHRARRPVAVATPLPPEVPLIGRAAQHTQLVTAFYTARRGQAQVVTLEGEAGIGKTRLATDFLGWAAGQGADVIQGKAFETGGRLPYQPLVQALRPRLDQENAPDDLLTDVWLAELSRLLPELRDRYPDLSVPATAPGEAAARTRLFEAVARLGQALAGRAPLVIFIDDVQWADTASLDLLHYVAGRWLESGAPVLLLLSLRTEDLAAASPLAGWLAGLDRDLPLARLSLGPFTVEETLQLLYALAGRPEDEPASTTEGSAIDRPWAPVETFGRWLFAETGGQPFYIMETLKVLAERGALRVKVGSGEAGRWALDLEAGWPAEAEPEGWRSVPPGIRELIRARLERLSPSAFALLFAGAVLGQSFSFENVCQIADLKESEGLPALEDLLAGHLLQEGGDEARLPPELPYFFTHDKIRDVVYTEASEARRRVFHRRALDVLQARAAPAAELAHHALAAGLPETGFRLTVEAGDDAFRLFAVKLAIAHYEQAQRLLAGDPGRAGVPVAAGQVQHLHMQLGRAYELSSGFDKAREVYAAMLAYGRRSGAPEMEWMALNRLATLTAQGLNDFEAAVALLNDARAVAERSGDRAGLAETEWNLAQIGFYNFDAETALRHGRRALALAREIDRPELIARSLNVTAYAETIGGSWEAVEIHAAEARELYAALGNRALEADSLSLVGKARINCGRTQAGLAATRTALAISREIENPWGQANCANHLGFGLLENGQYGEALAVAQMGVATARTVWYAPLLAFNLTVLGNIYRAMLALDEARAAHLEVVAVNETMPVRPFSRTIAAELCADCALAGAWDEALAYARQALAARDISLIHSGLNRWFEIEALLRAGEVTLAQQEVRRLGERVGDNRRYQIAYRRCLAVLAGWNGEMDGAIAELVAANTLAEEIGLPGEQWSILAKLRELYRAAGDEAQARQARSAAAGIIRELANSVEDESLRTGFLDSGPVKGVLEEA